MVGDSPADVESARRAGALSIGYARASADLECLTAAGADATILSMADLALRLRARVTKLGRRLLQLSLRRFQGRTFGAPGLTAQAVNSEDGREQLREKSGQGDPP